MSEWRQNESQRIKNRVCGALWITFLLFAIPLVFLRPLLAPSTAHAFVVDVMWGYPQKRIPPGQRFAIYRQEECTGEFARIGLVPSTERTYTDTTVEPGTKYCYEVRLLRADGTESASPPPAAEDLPDVVTAPVNLRTRARQGN